MLQKKGFVFNRKRRDLEIFENPSLRIIKSENPLKAKQITLPLLTIFQTTVYLSL